MSCSSTCSQVVVNSPSFKYPQMISLTLGPLRENNDNIRTPRARCRAQSGLCTPKIFPINLLSGWVEQIYFFNLNNVMGCRYRKPTLAHIGFSRLFVVATLSRRNKFKELAGQFVALLTRWLRGGGTSTPQIVIKQ